MLSRSRINAEKKKFEIDEEEEEVLKNQAGNWVRVYPYVRVVRAAKRKMDGVIVYYIHWPETRIWHTVTEMRSTVPEPIFKASELKSGIDRQWLVNGTLLIIFSKFNFLSSNNCFFLFHRKNSSALSKQNVGRKDEK